LGGSFSPRKDCGALTFFYQASPFAALGAFTHPFGCLIAATLTHKDVFAWLAAFQDVFSSGCSTAILKNMFRFEPVISSRQGVSLFEVRSLNIS
jgi:hypothetical protein